MPRKLLITAALLAAGLVSSSAHAVSDVWAFDLRAAPTPGGRMLRFPINAVPANTAAAATAATNIPLMTFDTFAMDWNSAGTDLWTIEEVAVGPGRIGRIDQVTGAFLPGPLITGAAAAEASFSGLRVDPTNETFYAASGASLYTIDPVTGVTALVGPFTGGPVGSITIDIAISNTGQMYGHEIAGDMLYSINKATGAMTPLGATGFLANFAQGMDFDPETNRLYATIYTGGGAGVFAEFNLTTGAATTVGVTTAWNAEMEMAIRAVPEPTSLALVALGGLALAKRRRRA